MNAINTSSIQNKILSAIGGGDILFLVPPFTTNTPVIGPHILQAIAREKGYQADILYLTLLLASHIGIEFSEELGNSQILKYWSMLTERLFARSAYGLPPLGKSPELCLDDAASISGTHRHHRRMDFDRQELDLERFWKLEEICTSFVEAVVQVLVSLPYKIIGCTTRIGQTNCSVTLLNGIKQKRPDVTTIVGGANCQNDMAAGIASLSQSIDYVFSGESEESFSLFLDQYSRNQCPAERLIPGKALEELETQPLLNYESYFEQREKFLGFQAAEKTFIWYETSRGCWWGQKKKCNFCGRSNETIHFRQKSSQKVLRDLRSIKEQYPQLAVAMTDNIMPRSYYKELLPQLAKEKEFPSIGMYYIKANTKFQDLVALKQAKVGRIIPGIEALSTGLLTLLNKGVTARENLQLLRNGRAVGLDLHWFMLWGVPGDKIAYYEEILALLPLLRHLQPPSALFCVHLERNSSYVLSPEAHNIKNLRPWEVYKMIYPEWADIHKLASFFIGDYPCESLEHPELIQKLADEVACWRKEWKSSNLVLTPFDRYYMIYDSRGPGKTRTHTLEAEEAQEMMKHTTYTESEYQRRAVEEKLGVVVDSYYVPLVTAAPDLLLTFER